ncbi:hypothetical protein ACLOJK_005099 [Asimina triloba]
MNSIFCISVLLLLPLIFAIGLLIRQHKNLPPGPAPWPIVGNLLQLTEKPHVALANMARTYGPLISLRLGTQLLVAASSPSAAAQVLKTHDRLLCTRDVPHTYRILEYTPFSLAFAVHCDDRWKALRTVCRAELFTPRMLDAQTHVREKTVSDAVRFINRQKLGKELQVAEMAFTAVYNMLGNVVFSRDVLPLPQTLGGDDDCQLIAASGLKHEISRVLELGLAPNLADFYPMLAPLDIQGLNRAATAIYGKLCRIWHEFIEERRATGGHNGVMKKDFLDVLLSAGYEDLPLKALISDMFVAGTDTSATLTEWTMSELIRNPEAMKRVRDELVRVVGCRGRDGKNSVKESHLVHLDYLHACIKETLRLHPPAPLLLPRSAAETCEVMNYTIPKGCRVMVNVWAIGRDPQVWEDPLKFYPERFLDGSIDFKGRDFEFTPFGAGRRICPGMPLATRVVQLILASFIHAFEWSLPDGMKPQDLDMEEKFGLTLERANPLVLVATSSSEVGSDYVHDVC